MTNIIVNYERQAPVEVPIHVMHGVDMLAAEARFSQDISPASEEAVALLPEHTSTPADLDAAEARFGADPAPVDSGLEVKSKPSLRARAAGVIAVGAMIAVLGAAGNSDRQDAEREAAGPQVTHSDVK